MNAMMPSSGSVREPFTSPMSNIPASSCMGVTPKRTGGAGKEPFEAENDDSNALEPFSFTPP